MNRIRDRRWDGKSRWEPCHVLSPLPVSADDGISAEPRKMAGNEITPDRRHSLRQKVNTPAFASFDGVTGGVILDLSEEGLAMHTAAPLNPIACRFTLACPKLPNSIPPATSPGQMPWAVPECASPIFRKKHASA